jgi:tetratricopeptide (TPR) repeat protein
VSPDSAHETLVDGERLTVDDGAPPTTIGRYVVLDRLGTGGMGIVYAAWDPGLDRRVAIKVLFASRHHEDELAEARALARFSHPDVVSIYDAGTIGGRVWIAMELLDGLTLDRWAWARGRSWQEILRVLVAAGRGLAAVHEAGLVHRDVKPSNVFVADDGRVLVMDFGLATADMAATTGCDGSPRVLGTLAYMAPEQYDGGIVDARADQFAFCVVAWELLHGEHPFGADPRALAIAIATREAPRSSAVARPVPEWVRDVLRRGMSPRPADRHASMPALLEAIGRGRRRRRGRDVVLGCVGALAVAAAVIGARRIGDARRDAQCHRHEAELEAVWPGPGGEVRESVRVELHGIGAERSERAITAIDAWSARWRELHALACAGRGAQEEQERHAARLACFSRDVTELDALVDTLVGHDDVVDARWLEASTQLPETERCADDRLSSEDAAPPLHDQGDVDDVHRMLMRARALRVTGDYARGLELAERASAEARRVAWPSLSARAGLELARARQGGGDSLGAVEIGEAAYFEAVSAGDDEIATEIAGTLGFITGDRLVRSREATMWIRHARSRFARLSGAHPRLAVRVDLDDALVALAEGDETRAKALREAALVEYERLYGPDDPMIVMVLANLAVTYERTGEFDRSEAAALRAGRILRAAYGEGHPELGMLTLNLGTVYYKRFEFEKAEATYREALPMLAAALGEDHPAYLLCWSNLAGMAWRRNDLHAAREAFRHAAEVGASSLGTDHPQFASILYNSGLVEVSLGEYDEGERFLARALAIRDHLPSPNRPETAMVLGKLALLHRRAGKDGMARAEVERALAIRRRVELPDFVQETALTLAATLAKERGELPAAASLYDEALLFTGRENIWSLEPLIGRAETAMGLGDVETALELSGLAVQILERIPLADELAARGWLVRARALWRAGERADVMPMLERAEAFAGGVAPVMARDVPDEIVRFRRSIR